MMTDGLAKAIGVLGSRISELEEAERWEKSNADRYKRERDAMCKSNCAVEEENRELSKQLHEANEKIREYERTIIIDESGTPMFVKDMPEIPLSPELEKEIRASLDRGVSPDKDSK